MIKNIQLIALANTTLNQEHEYWLEHIPNLFWSRMNLDVNHWNALVRQRICYIICDYDFENKVITKQVTNELCKIQKSFIWEDTLRKIKIRPFCNFENRDLKYADITSKVFNIHGERNVIGKNLKFHSHTSLASKVAQIWLFQADIFCIT